MGLVRPFRNRPRGPDFGSSELEATVNALFLATRIAAILMAVLIAVLAPAMAWLWLDDAIDAARKRRIARNVPKGGIRR